MTVISIITVGLVATAFLDLYLVFVQPRLFGSPFTGMGMFGRWCGHLPKGKVIHTNISKAEPINGEKLIGWIGHYVIGIVFAGVVVFIWGTDWLQAPALAPAMIVGIVSVLAPFFIMQPGFGQGFAASRTSNPWAARIRSIVSHIVFGFGLYAGGLVAAWIK